MICTFLSVVCSLSCACYKQNDHSCIVELFASILLSLVLLSTLSTTPSTQRNRNMQCRFTQRSLFQLMAITYNDFIATENAGMVTRICSVANRRC